MKIIFFIQKNFVHKSNMRVKYLIFYRIIRPDRNDSATQVKDSGLRKEADPVRTGRKNQHIRQESFRS